MALLLLSSIVSLLFVVSVAVSQNVPLVGKSQSHCNVLRGDIDCDAVVTVRICKDEKKNKNFLNELDPLATCNDGTPAVSFTRPGYGSGANRFVIRLQGGGWCYDQVTCDIRKKYTPFWTTSTSLPAVLYDNETISGVPHEGILSSNQSQNPTFYNWNHVYVWYCSSDAHIGNMSNSINGWNFYGKNIVRATMLLLIQKMNLKNATDVLVTGDSAGGVGTVNNADFVGSYVYSVAPNANFRAFVDCGWFLNIPAYGTGELNFKIISQSLLLAANVQYNENCVKALGESYWMCFHTQYTYLNTLLFSAEFQFDSSNLETDLVVKPFNDSTTAFALSFQKEMQQAQLQAPYLFSASCYLHETIDSANFTQITIGGTSISDAVGKWMFMGSTSSPPPPMRYLDSCSGIGCNPTCIKTN